ncbi:MAG: hypothetical protein JNK23_10440 [Opitutaceae bacterium]|nr:hypothetical protein [Opitutaceae bacterium]
MKKDEEMTARELRGRLADMHRRLERLEANRGHTFIICALVILLLRGCS